MDRKEVISQVEKYIYQSLTYKSEIESNKLEFKRAWYNLKTDDVYTCSRHITGIANSLGGGDAFLVFGYDPNDQTFHPSLLTHSSYNDPTEIYGVINKRISNDVSFEIIDFQYDNNPISIIHILPSISKPHILPHYKDKNGKESRHVTFIRNGAKTDIATRDDFERMYMDRKNIIVDHKLVFHINKKLSHIQFIDSQGSGFIGSPRLKLECTFENFGFRTLRIGKITLDVVADFLKEIGLENGRINYTSSMLATYSGSNTPVISPDENYQRKIIFFTEHSFIENGSYLKVEKLNNYYDTKLDQPSKLEFANIRVWMYNGFEIIPEILINDFT